MSSCKGTGRLGNIVFRCLASSIIAERFNLSIDYCDGELVERLGIKLFNGDKVYPKSTQLTDNNYQDILSSDKIDYNIIAGGYYQTKYLSSIIHKYLISEPIINKVVSSNKHKHRYNNNNDCFIHIRLGDVAEYNPGLKYYKTMLSKIPFNKIYISSDSLTHHTVVQLQTEYPDVEIYDTELTDIIKFASTCKYVILSYGTFSSIIGYLSYYSYVYCLDYCQQYAWDFHHPCAAQTFDNKFSKLGKWISFPGRNSKDVVKCN
jgi:hypothetical protein